MRSQKFAVYGPCFDKHENRIAGSWTAYTMYVSETWPGFRGWFDGDGDTRPRRKADAIRKAKAAEPPRACEPAEGGEGGA